MQPSLCLVVEVKGCVVGSAKMFRSKKSRKNILGLIEALQIQQNETEGKRATGNVMKKKERKGNNQRKETVSPRDEGYITGNEKNNEFPEFIEDDSDEWDVETDNNDYQNGLNQKKDENVNTEEKKDSKPAPVRNQTAPSTGVFGVNLFPFSSTPLRRSSPEEDFLCTLAGVQTLLHQQKHILREYEATLANHNGDNHPAYLTIPRPKIVKNDCKMKTRRMLEMESLRTFQKRIEKKLDMKENILYDICNL